MEIQTIKATQIIQARDIYSHNNESDCLPEAGTTQPDHPLADYYLEYPLPTVLNYSKTKERAFHEGLSDDSTEIIMVSEKAAGIRAIPGDMIEGTEAITN